MSPLGLKKFSCTLSIHIYAQSTGYRLKFYTAANENAPKCNIYSSLFTITVARTDNNNNKITTYGIVEQLNYTTKMQIPY